MSQAMLLPHRPQHLIYEDILELVCLTLEQVGHTMIRASDGDEALELARRHKPDVCVLDVVMPSRTGIEVSTMGPARMRSRKPLPRSRGCTR